MPAIVSDSQVLHKTKESPPKRAFIGLILLRVRFDYGLFFIPTGDEITLECLHSTLAIRTIMRSAAGHEHAPYGRLAPPARFPRPLVNAVLYLKESPLSIGIHIIGNR